jgi:DNA-binding MarR family transcriptional regulator
LDVTRPAAKTLADEIKQTRPFSSPAQEATIALLRTANVVRRRLSRLVEREDVTLQQYNVLRILRGAKGPLSALEIQDRLVEDAPGVSRLIDRLVFKGFVRRDRGTKDRRLLECWITGKGLEVLERLDVDVDRLDVSVLDGLTARDINELTNLLAKVRAANE